MTQDEAFTELRKLALRWRGDADARKRTWREDPVASTMAALAGELDAEVTRLGHETARVNVTEYAELRGVTPQCVRRWIRLGRLSAAKTPNGFYSISRTARVQRRRTAA